MTMGDWEELVAGAFAAALALFGFIVLNAVDV